MLTDKLSVDRDHVQPDPPLTTTGSRQAHEVQLPAEADLVVVSPMTRTIQTALIVFNQLLNRGSASLKLEVWPDLREAHDAICNTGVGRPTLGAQFDRLDFSD
jgi:broad specificity phosphatase PhoE